MTKLWTEAHDIPFEDHTLEDAEYEYKRDKETQMKTPKTKSPEPTSPILNEEDILDGTVFGTPIYGVKQAEIENYLEVARVQAKKIVEWLRTHNTAVNPQAYLILIPPDWERLQALEKEVGK
ncbi:MAG: hypothetical protein MUP81_02935 [Dehalococcoidia bacterium]|nr:hypothetical protein [Dehalococcoidia bacterium]